MHRFFWCLPIFFSSPFLFCLHDCIDFKVTEQKVKPAVHSPVLFYLKIKCQWHDVLTSSQCFFPHSPLPEQEPTLHSWHMLASCSSLMNRACCGCSTLASPESFRPHLSQPDVLFILCSPRPSQLERVIAKEIRRTGGKRRMQRHQLALFSFMPFFRKILKVNGWSLVLEVILISYVFLQ